MTIPACFLVKSYRPTSVPRMSAISFSKAAVESFIRLPIDRRYSSCLLVAVSSWRPLPLLDGVQQRALLSGRAPVSFLPSNCPRFLIVSGDGRSALGPFDLGIQGCFRQVELLDLFDHGIGYRDGGGNLPLDVDRKARRL